MFSQVTVAPDADFASTGDKWQVWSEQKRFQIIRARNGALEATLLGPDPNSVFLAYVQRWKLPSAVYPFLLVRRAGRRIEFERHGLRFRLLCDCSHDRSHKVEETLVRIALDRIKRMTTDEDICLQIHQGLQIYHPAVHFCAEAGRVLGMLQRILDHYRRREIWTLALEAIDATPGEPPATGIQWCNDSTTQTTY